MSAAIAAIAAEFGGVVAAGFGEWSWAYGLQLLATLMILDHFMSR